MSVTALTIIRDHGSGISRKELMDELMKQAKVSRTTARIMGTIKVF